MTSTYKKTNQNDINDGDDDDDEDECYSGG